MACLQATGSKRLPAGRNHFASAGPLQVVDQKSSKIARCANDQDLPRPLCRVWPHCCLLTVDVCKTNTIAIMNRNAKTVLLTIASIAVTAASLLSQEIGDVPAVSRHM